LPVHADIIAIVEAGSNICLTCTYAVQVVISPHVYGPSISLTTNDDAGTALWTRLSQSFGYLNLAGYGGHRFPIAIGEFGTTFAETADQVLFADLARYLQNVQADGTPPSPASSGLLGTQILVTQVVLSPVPIGTPLYGRRLSTCRA